MIREAINRQIEMVRREAAPAARVHSEHVDGGQRAGPRRGAEIPKDVVRVWADNGRGMIEDGGQIGAGDGVYYHTGVIGRNGNNLSERVPVDRIARELGRAAKAGAMRYLLLNPSNIRPHAMTTRAVMELAWDARPWTASADEASDEFLCAVARGVRRRGRAGRCAVLQGLFRRPGAHAAPEAETISDVFQQWSPANCCCASFTATRPRPFATTI